MVPLKCIASGALSRPIAQNGAAYGFTSSPCPHDVTARIAPSKLVLKITITNPKNQDSVTFLETSATTGGQRTLLEVEVAPGGRNRLHFHKTFTEHFIATAGPVRLATVDGDLTLQPGERFSASPHVQHAFFNDTGAPMRFEVEMTPANEPFELFLQVAYGLINDTWTLPGGFPINPLHLGVLYELGDTHYKGILQWMTPLAAMMAALARWTGTRRRLIDAYAQTQRTSHTAPATALHHTDTEKRQ